MDVYITLIQIQQQISGFGQKQLLRQLENIIFVSKGEET